MTKAKYVRGVKGMLIEKPLMHRPARLIYWAVWCPLSARQQKVGLFAPEYGGAPMLFHTKAAAVKHIGRAWRRGVPVKVSMRISQDLRKETR